MPRRPTLQDIAREAGVGIATVDRVVNGRARVREATALRVAEAARRLGHPLPGIAGPALPRVRFGFVLHKGTQAFYRAFTAALQAAVAARTDISGRATIAFAASQAPDDFADEFRRLAKNCDVLAGTAVNHPAVDRAVDEIAAEGKAVFALLSDFAQGVRHAYVGLDNQRAGRIAGWAVAALARGDGPVGIFVGGGRWHGQLLREAGFTGYLREAAPGLRLLDTLVNLETRQVTYEATLRLLDREPGLRGLYIAGGGMEGAIAALREARAPGEVALVVNERTPESEAALADRTAALVMATPLDDLCRELVDLMVRQASGAGAPGGRHFLESRLWLPESV